MSLDACYLNFLTTELKTDLVGSRVDKIYMPSRDEAVFALRGKQKCKLLINASTNAPRISITEAETENPAVPPTFCMVLRKHFLSSRLIDVRMTDFEREISFDFECKNDFFEPVNKTITVSLMGRSANMILVGEDGRIIDAIRRIDLTSGGRCILPGVKFEKPVPQAGKIPFDRLENTDKVFENPELTFENAIMTAIAGISPIVARELAYRACGKSEMRIRQLGTGDAKRLYELCEKLRLDMQTGECSPCVIRRKQDKKLIDFCFMPITQYGDFCECIPFEKPSAAIEFFYSDSARKTRLEQRTGDLSRFITRTHARISRTLAVREKELLQSQSAETVRVMGELINANLYRITKGMKSVTAENYYDDLKEVKIPLKAELSPSQNAALYFKKYQKLKNSAKILKTLIEKDKQELSYLDSVFMSLCDCESASDAVQIRQELENTGYLKRKTAKRAAEKPSSPRVFERDGFEIYVGRNNIQNDMVTVRISRKNDIWLHTKNIHSSHVLISCRGEKAPDSVILYAARLCAFYSKAKNDLKVEVDYCPVQNVKKPAGAKPGMVVYDNYTTVVVEPFKEDEI